MRGVIAGVVLAASVVSPAWAGPVDEVPAAFAPFEHMVGGWKGTAKPSANPLKGWQESHGWAWKFDKGIPVGMSVNFEGDKTLAKGQLTFDAAAKKYHLNGADPEGKPLTYIGVLSTDGKVLTLDRVAPVAAGKERLTLRPNSNKIRYTLQLDRQEKGAPQFKKVIEVGLTKDGEAFAAGGGQSNLPKCILTGGAAGMSVSYMGKTYPVCCSGCRDEFNDNPAKYAKKADAAGLEAPAPPDAKPAPPAEATKPKAPDAKPKEDSEVKAARELNLGQTFEQGGKTALALEHFRKVVKDYPTSEFAKTAAARIKALESR